MWFVGALSVTSILSGLTDLVINEVIGIFNEFITLIVSVLVDAIIYIFHNGILKPLVTELYGNFVLSSEMFSNTEIMGILLNYCYAKMRMIGIAIMILISSWQLFKTFFAYFVQTEVEEGLKIAAKLMIFTTLAWCGKDICLVCVKVGSEVIRGLIELALKQTASSDVSTKELMKSSVEGMFTVMENLNFSAFSTGGDALGIFDLVRFVFILKIDMQLLKLGVGMAEKCVTMIFMILISPVAFACGTVKSKSTILSKWVSLFTSTLLYNILQSLVMSFLFFTTTFMTEEQSICSFFGSWIPPTYMLKDGYTFKYITMMWAVLALGKNAVDMIDELGFSYLGENTSDFSSLKGALSFAAGGLMGGKMVAQKAFNIDKNLLKKGKNKWDKIRGKGPKTNYGDMTKDPGGGSNTNYGDMTKDPGGGSNTNYGGEEEDDDETYYDASDGSDINYGYYD